MTTPTPLRRRWYQFGLRTMFAVLTAFAVWLGWQSGIVRDRRAIIQAVRGQPGGSVRIWTSAISCFESPPQELLPLWRRWLGDQNIAHIALPRSSSMAEVAKARRLFPEAGVGREGEWLIRLSDEPEWEEIVDDLNWAAVLPGD